MTEKLLFSYRTVDHAERMTVDKHKLLGRCDMKPQLVNKHHRMSKIRQVEALELIKKQFINNITSVGNS